nr:MAG TPA: hypothetical protein [Caudoviricetes sp.]
MSHLSADKMVRTVLAVLCDQITTAQVRGSIYSNLPLPVTGPTSICNVIKLNRGKY